MAFFGNEEGKQNRQVATDKRAINRPPVLFTETQKIIAEIEKETKCTFITYWNSYNGSVCQDDVVGLYELLGQIGKQNKICMFIKSDGGNGQAALRIVNLLRDYTSDLIAMVPLNCVSAATMVALGANEIQMGPLAYLSAVDTSLTHSLSPVDNTNNRVSVSQNELARILRLWQEASSGKAEDSNPYKSIFDKIHPLVIGAVDRASSLSIRLSSEILSYHITDPKKVTEISHKLNSDYPSHTYPITLREAQRVGLNAVALDQKINTLLIELNELYSEMGQSAFTDYDEENYHDHQILNILEANKDWYYRKEERRWMSMNDKSSWRKIEKKDGKLVETVVHIR
jgi:hypothetical protein